jgi:ankyrin repeat protein
MNQFNNNFKSSLDIRPIPECPRSVVSPWQQSSIAAGGHDKFSVPVDNFSSNMYFSNQMINNKISMLGASNQIYKTEDDFDYSRIIQNTENVLLKKFQNYVRYYNKSNDEEINNFITDNLCISDSNNITLLKIALWYGNETLVRRILDKTESFDENIFSFACLCKSNMDIINLLLQKYPQIDINKQEENILLRPITIAIKKTNLDLVKLLLSYETIDVNTQDNNGFLPVIYAMNNYNNEIVTLLLIHDKTDLCVSDSFGTTLLEIACNLSNSNFVKLILRNKNFNSEYYETISNECLVTCIKYNMSIDVVESFYPFVNINYQDTYNHTALMYACINNKLDIVKSLLKIETIDISLVDNFGYNALLHSVECGNNICTKYLLNYMSTALTSEQTDLILNTKNNSGESVLLLASRDNNTDVIMFLNSMKLVLNVNVVDNYGKTPLMYSITNKNFNFFKNLLSKGADVNQMDSEGNSVLMQAITNSSVYADELYALSLLQNPLININVVNKTKQNALLVALIEKYNGSKESKFTADSNVTATGVDFSSYPMAFDYPINGTALDKLKNNTDKTHYDIIINAILRNNTVNPNIADNSGFNALMYAAKNNDELLFNRLLTHKNSNINAIGKNGKSCLLYLLTLLSTEASDDTKCQQISSIHSDSFISSYMKPISVSSLPSTNDDKLYMKFINKLLTCQTINVNLQDIFGYTALTYSAKYMLSDVFQLLVPKSNLNLKSFDEYTALMYCVKNKDWDNISLLLTYKPDLSNVSQVAESVGCHAQLNHILTLNNMVLSNNSNDEQSFENNSSKKTKSWF